MRPGSAHTVIARSLACAAGSRCCAHREPDGQFGHALDVSACGLRLLTSVADAQRLSRHAACNGGLGRRTLIFEESRLRQHDIGARLNLTCVRYSRTTASGCRGAEAGGDTVHS
jgi:hypothetical protein